MKVKYCLVGIAMLAMPSQVHGWGFFANIFHAIVSIFVPPAPAPRPAPAPTPTPTPTPTPKVIKTKTIMMRTNIMPTWGELAPVSAVKIKLGRVTDYWSGMLESDLNTYSSLYTTTAEKEAAKTKILAYYSAATKCLTEHSLTTPNPPETFSVRINDVGTCVAKAAMPQFVVLDTNMVTPKMPMYVPGEHLDPDDYAPPPTPAPTPPPTFAPTPPPTEAPTEAPTLAPVSFFTETPTLAPESTPAPHVDHQTYYEDESPIEMHIQSAIDSEVPPWMLNPPGKNGAGIPPLALISEAILDVPSAPILPKPQAPDAPVWMQKTAPNPKAAAVPDFRTVDGDSNGLVTLDEWVDYVNSLGRVAREVAKRADGEHGFDLLSAIIEHHYKRLAKCVTVVAGEATEKALDAAEFQEVAPRIEAHCNVKFRYSLLAGPPPFEWVAGHKSTVTADHVSSWLAREREIAAKDAMPMPASLVDEIGCFERTLLAKRHEPVDRLKFYGAVMGCTVQT